MMQTKKHNHCSKVVVLCYVQASQDADITCRAPEAACWPWLGFWSNSSANSHPSSGAFNRRVGLLRACLVPQCSYLPHRPRHRRRLANCDWMPASYTSGQPSSNPRKHPAYWASSQWSHTVSSTPCHGAWKSAPPSAHPSIECRCTAPEIETSICTRRTTTHQFIWQQQHTCGALGGSPMECGVADNPTRLRIFFTPDTGTHPSGMTLPRRALVPLNRLRTGIGRFRSCLYKWGLALFCDLWVWRRRTNSQPCRPPMSNSSTSPWTAWPDGSGRWDNRMASQHLPRELVRTSSG